MPKPTLRHPTTLLTLWFCWLALGAVFFSAPSAQAQERTFYLDRAQISGAPDDGYMVWRPYMHERTRFYGQFALGYTLNPLRKTAVTDDGRTQNRIENLMQHQLIGYPSIGTEIAHRLGLNLSLPVALYQVPGEDPQVHNVGGGLAAKKVAMHDLRFDVRVLAYESDNRKFRLGFGGALWAGIGAANSFAGDDQSTGMLYGSGEYDFGGFFLTGMVGPHFRPERGIGGSEGDLRIANELRWALGGFLPLRDNRIRLGLELWGSAGIGDSAGQDTTFAKRNTDLEWLLQGRFALDEKRRVWAMAGAGTRLSTGYGAPDLRVLASIGYWFPITDSKPKSPKRRYRAAPDVDDHASDRDGDGYPDDIDKCPDIPEDGKEPDPTDGCPVDADRDGDGIPDKDDACPDVPEDKDGIEDEDGCPEKDADNDGILDQQDACPTEPGPRSDIAEKNGCPSLTKVTEDGTVQLLEPIQFEFGKAVIKPVSYPILDEVVTLMKARSKIRIGVYGHTDSRGSDQLNMRLSKQRAAACMAYLKKKGIAGNRLESEGYGETKPIASNDTDEGRAKNRRVEFKILSE